MHPAFIYVVHQVLEDERRRMSSHLPDPDPSEEFAPRPIVAAPQRSGRSPRARLAAGRRGLAPPDEPGRRRLGRLEHSRVREHVERVDEVRRRRHVLVAVDQLEPALEQRLEQRIGPRDDGVDGSAAPGPSQGLERRPDRFRVRPHDESVEGPGLGRLAGASVARGDRAPAASDTTNGSASACVAQNAWSIGRNAPVHARSSSASCAGIRRRRVQSRLGLDRRSMGRPGTGTATAATSPPARTAAGPADRRRRRSFGAWRPRRAPSAAAGRGPGRAVRARRTGRTAGRRSRHRRRRRTRRPRRRCVVTSARWLAMMWRTYGPTMSTPLDRSVVAMRRQDPADRRQVVERRGPDRGRAGDQSAPPARGPRP